MIEPNRVCINCGHKWVCNPRHYCVLKKDTSDVPFTAKGCRSLCIACLIKEDELVPDIYDKLQMTDCYKKEDKKYLVACLL